MTIMKRVWHYLMGEPLTWIFLAFFQPARLRREIEPAKFSQRIKPMLRLILPMFLVSYPFTMLVQTALLPFHLLIYTNITSFLFVPLVGIAFGIAFSTAFGIGFGIGTGIGIGIGGGIGGGVALSIGFGIGFGVALSVALSIGLGTSRGIEFGIVRGIGVGIGFGIVYGIVGGIAGGSVGIGIMGGILTFMGFFLGSYRIPLYLVSGPSALKAYLSSLQKPSEVFALLQRSSLHWDERVYLPLPYLKRTLLIAYDEQPDMALEEIAFIAAERPQQLRAAQAAALEIAMRDLETRKTLHEIAGASERLNEILPQEARLIDPKWGTVFARLSDASRDAMSSTLPIGRQARSQAIEKMIANLHKIYPNAAFRDQRLNRRLQQVVETWLEVAWHEQEHLKQAAQDIGKIDNPYKPGQILKPHDSLFVGRTDLALQLEAALNKGSRRPTVLLNGERRMGKSSTLLQLPYLLGSTYIPVFYNLQDPGMYAKSTTFLGTLAQGIYNEMSTRSMPVTQLSYSILQDSRQINDPAAYNVFEGWLANVEATLVREDRILLLAFDEFEKLEEAGQAGDLNLRLLLDWFRKVIQFHPRIALLFSGVHTFSEMGGSTGVNWPGYFVNVQALKVSFLERDEARHVIVHPRADYPGETIFSQAVVEEIIHQTGCHPFLVQAICSEIIDTLNTYKREQAEISDVKHAVEQVLEAWNGYFSDLWIRTGEEQQACLVALRELENGNLQQVQQQSGLDEKSVRRSVQTLLKRDLVRLNENNAYQIATPIFSKWVEQNS